MSRIGRNPVKIIEGVTVTIDKDIVTVTGPQGILTLVIPHNITVEVQDGIVYVARLSEDKKVKACHGATRAHINNMITGVTTPWKKDMEIRGTGYKFALNNGKLIVTAGFINPVEMVIPADIKIAVADDTKLTITGANKVVVGQIASNIRKIRKPEPYKGKGIRYLNEFIKLKAGKTAKA
ncbi:MAG: 50S ribosomal protein L6 [Candidatus Shapirobacteria bacterium]|nr:50S ribosomal protein L6 [Candidatus Shapirobacteria bacterium]